MPDLIEIAEAYAEAAATLQVVGQNAEAARLYQHAERMLIGHEPPVDRLTHCIALADQCHIWAQECIRAELTDETYPTEGGIPI